MTDVTYQAIAMIIYFVAMLAIGGWAYLRTDNFDDYMLACRVPCTPAAWSRGGSPSA